VPLPFHSFFDPANESKVETGSGIVDRAGKPFVAIVSPERLSHL
jgi:hypothetical protein